LIARVFELQIATDTSSYVLEMSKKTEKTRYSTATRGNIYDADGNLLAYNKTTYSVQIEDTVDSSNYKNSQLNEIIAKTINIIEKNGDSLINDFPVTYSSGSYSYASSLTESTINRFLKNIYGTETLDTEKKKLSQTTAEEAVEYLKSDEKYEIDTELYDEELAWKIAMIRYDLSLNMYQKYIATTIAKNVSEKTMAAIYESQNEIQGVTIGEDTQRIYNNSLYFAHIIGYTGKISEEQMNELNSQLSTDDIKYELNDIVGKDGIEESCELTLSGTKGYEKVLVNNMGQVQSVVDEKKSVAGNDVYLTIRSDLQIGIYHLIEQKLAGILAANIVNSLVDENNNSSWKISIYDVYFQVINNNMVDCDKFNEEGSSQNEQAVYQQMINRKTQIMQTIESQLRNSSAGPLSSESTEMNEYYTYIFNLLSNSSYGINLIPKSSIDTDDETYKNWMRDGVSLRDMLLYCIDNDWVDTSLLDVDAVYIDKDTIYNALIDYIKNYLDTDKEFTKLIYKYLIYNGSIYGSQICKLLYDQNVLPYDNATYARLTSGSYSAYDFMMTQIKNLTITPAMLALKPCSASVTITQPGTSNVLAMVSYPSYDNNVFSGAIDADYWNQLNEDKSSPLYARATRMRTAPGSTFKPMSATAGLEEGVISTGSYISCGGIFTKITPSPKCWVYPSAHGSLNVVGGIKNSCNVFFYEVGYRLGSMSNGTYSDSEALERLKKYGEMYGLTQTSGVEVQESDPMFSTTSGVASAIGQGSHSFTGVQLARYVNTIASGGVNYELTLIDKIVDIDGNEQPKAEKNVTKLDIADSTLNAIQSGMSAASASYKLDSYLGMSAAAKTGTAQENEKYPDHALIITYAPFNNPEIAMSINIQYGYTSTRATELAESVYDFYFGKTTLEQILAGNSDGPAKTMESTQGQ
jgi:penicillin-binding protein 2